jgi:TRAP-type mannitol/chloroaromatic compound transport system permease small subunit
MKSRKETENAGSSPGLISLIGRVSEASGKAASWLSLLLVLMVSTDVFLRYLFNITFVAVQELEWHLYALIFLLGSAYTLKYNAHVRVDVIYQRLSKRTRAFINVVGCLLFLFPGCYLIIKTSIPFVESSWAMHEGSPDPGGLPGRYLLKAAIPLAFALTALQGIAMFYENLMRLLGRDSRAKGDSGA